MYQQFLPEDSSSAVLIHGLRFSSAAGSVEGDRALSIPRPPLAAPFPQMATDPELLTWVTRWPVSNYSCSLPWGIFPQPIDTHRAQGCSNWFLICFNSCLEASSHLPSNLPPQAGLLSATTCQMATYTWRGTTARVKNSHHHCTDYTV